MLSLTGRYVPGDVMVGAIDIVRQLILLAWIRVFFSLSLVSIPYDITKGTTKTNNWN